MYRCILHRAAIAALAVLACSGADWPQFRGDGRSLATGSPPASWSDSENVQWKAPLPGRGPSGPIVIGDRVIVTCSSGVNQDRLLVACFDVESGSERWRRSFWATGRTGSHPMSANAAPTPASDGKRVFAFFSSNDLACLDLDGNLLWFRGLAHDFPKAGNDVGMASSPAVADGVVAVQIESQGDAFAAGIDAETGTTLWRADRTRSANWSSPVVATTESGKQFLFQSPSELTSHDPRTGEVLWKYESRCDAIASPVVHEDRAYIPTPGGLALLRIPPRSGAPKVIWQKAALAATPSSPVVHQGMLYSLRNGILTCGDADSGQVLWKKRFEGEYWATPVFADNKLYFGNQDGQVHVVVLDDRNEPTQVHVNSMGEPLLASLAIVGDAIFIRTDAHLWKIAK